MRILAMALAAALLVAPGLTPAAIVIPSVSGGSAGGTYTSKVYTAFPTLKKVGTFKYRADGRLLVKFKTVGLTGPGDGIPDSGDELICILLEKWYVPPTLIPPSEPRLVLRMELDTFSGASVIVNITDPVLAVTNPPVAILDIGSGYCFGADPLFDNTAASVDVDATIFDSTVDLTPPEYRSGVDLPPTGSLPSSPLLFVF